MIKKRRNPSKDTVKMIELLEIANRPLTKKEIMVGYYRKYKEIKTMKQIENKIYQLMIHSGSRMENVGTIGRALYRLKESK